MTNQTSGQTPSQAPAVSTQRETKPALLRGWQQRCPNCGTAPLYQAYLKTCDHCEACGQDLANHRADDGPAYLTILVVGHLLAPVMHVVYFQLRPEPWVSISTFSVLCIALTLYLLPRLKGCVIAYQWAKRMYGFQS